MDNHPFTKSITIEDITRKLPCSKLPVMLGDITTVQLGYGEDMHIAKWSSPIADYTGKLPMTATEPIFFAPSREVFMAAWAALQTKEQS